MTATQNVLRHYSVETTQKGADFIALFGVVSMIVGTRIGAYNIRVRIEREQQQRPPFRPSVVVPMPQAPQPQAPIRDRQPASPMVEPDFETGEGGSF